MTATRLAVVAFSTTVLTSLTALLPALERAPGNPSERVQSGSAAAASATPHTLTTATTRTRAVKTRHVTVKTSSASAIRGLMTTGGTVVTKSSKLVTPNARIKVSGRTTAKGPARVKLLRRTATQKRFTAISTVRTKARGKRFTFRTALPRGVNAATYGIKVITAKGTSRTTVAKYTQVSAPDRLTVSTLSPGIVETGAQTSPESADNAAQLLRVNWATGPAARTATLQERRISGNGTRAWRDVETSARLRPNGSGTWFPRTGATSTAQYRAVFRYATGISTTSAAMTPARPRLVFSDEFSGNRLDTTRWSNRGENRCSFQTPTLDTVTVGGGTARLTPRIKPGSQRNVACSPCEQPTGEAPRRGSQCVEVPHIVSSAKITRPAPGKSAWMATRVKLQAGAAGDAQGGSHSSFWFNAGYCRGGEIDIFEYMGDNRLADGAHRTSKGAVAYKHYDLSTCDGTGTMDQRDLALIHEPTSSRAAHWSDQYTVFALRWTPRNDGQSAEYQVYVDGRHVATTLARGVKDADLGGMILSNFVSDYENRGAASLKNSTLTVDWVRAWEM